MSLGINSNPYIIWSHHMWYNSHPFLLNQHSPNQINYIDARKSIVYVIRLASNAAWEGASVSDVRIPTVPSVNTAVMLLPTEVRLPNLKCRQLTIPNVRVPRLLVLSCTVNASVRIRYAIPTASALIVRIPRRNQVPMEIVHVQGMRL